MELLVSSVKNLADQSSNLYYLISKDASKLFVLKSELVLNPGDEIEIEEDKLKESVDSGIIKASAIKNIGACKNVDLYLQNANKKANEMLKYEPLSGVEEIDKITRNMLKKLKDAALLFLSKLLLGAPIVVRFHNDSDGSSGAYCLFKSISGMGIELKSRISWRMHKSVFYSKDDASNDILFTNNFSSITKPLLFIIDFGTAIESNESISIAKEKLDIIWLDHHPVVEGFEGVSLPNYINPWLFGGDSDYTAGLLACTFSKLYSNIETKEIEGASLIGDYSKFASNYGKELSEILELITSDSKIINSRSITPYDIEGIMSNQSLKAELLGYARHHMSEALDLALNSLKVYKGSNANLYLLDFKNVRSEELRYPLPGRFASKLLTRIEELNSKPCIVVLHFSSFISIRLSKPLEINLLEVVKRAKEAFSNIDSAGGHKNAASIKLKSESSKKEIINFIVSELGFGPSHEA